MKKLLCLSCMILLLSGCSIVYVDKQPIDEIVDSVITEKTNLKSVSLEGYSYYLPQGVHLSRNDIIIIRRCIYMLILFLTTIK